MKNPSHIKGINSHLDLMYKFIGFALLGVVAMMIIPGNFDALQGEQPKLFFGAGTVTFADATGNELFTQTVHNQLVDTGETFMLENTFQDTVNVADNGQIGTICITNAAVVVNDGDTAGSFDTANTLDSADLPCIEDLAVVVSGGIATVNPATTFICGDLNCPDDTAVLGFAVCQADSVNDLDKATCAAGGVMFAEISISSTTLAAGETLDVTYTFDVSASGT